MSTITTMLRPATFGGRTRMFRAAAPAGGFAGVEGTTVSAPAAAPLAAPGATHVRTQSTGQITAAVANGVDAGLRTRRRPPA